ncbi:MAG TPA: hypothetical protein VK920_08925 [Solirubrobacterales bacterium]|nr:hypothetical protein [Solirubrobacterales bacterium]
MYDVVYVDRKSRRRVVATGLSRDSAAGIAREEARRLGAGRMFLAGSEEVPRSHAVVIVRTDE